MSKWEYSGQDKGNYFLLVFRGFAVKDLEGQKAVVAMRDTLDASIQGRDQTDKNQPVTSHRRWFPAVFKFGGELIQVRSIFRFSGFFALSCKVLDGSHDSEAIEAAVAEVNDRV